MNRLRTRPPSRHLRPKSAGALQLAVLATLLAAGLGGLTGCSAISRTSAQGDGNPVTIGTQANSLPSAPPQKSKNFYTAIDLQNNVDMTLYVSHPDKSFSYLQPGASNSQTKSGGVFNSFADFEYLAETDSQFTPYTFSGFNIEIDSALSMLEVAPGSSVGDLMIAVPDQQQACLAPNGSLSFSFLDVKQNGLRPYMPATDALYGTATLTYANGVLSYSKLQQLALPGTVASVGALPFADSVCVATDAGYGWLSPQSTQPGPTGSILLYIGPTGAIIGRSEATFVVGSTGFVGFVEPATPIDLAAVTKGTYRGYYLQPGSQLPAGLAYFGQKSPWITTPVFKQESGSLIGGNEGVYNVIFGPVKPPPIPANVLIDFGAQDSSHSGLFPSATIKEQDPSNLCPAKQQSRGHDGNTYCTFPVAALIGESYGKFAIFLSGKEPTTGLPLFYALIED